MTTHHCRLLRRSLRISIAATVCAASLLTMPPADAACPTASIDLPAKVSVDRGYQQISVPLVEACGAAYVSSDLYGPDGQEAVLIYDPAYDGAVDYWDVYDFSVRPGTYYLRDGQAWDADYNDVPVGDDTTVVKFGSSLGTATARYGSKVKVTVTARRYDAGSRRMIPRAGVTVGIREHVPGTNSGYTVRAYVKTTASGVASATLSSPYMRDWQAWFGASGSFWGATSIATRR